MSGPRIGLIWAESIGHVIGFRGDMPWNLPEDLAHFNQVTQGFTVIMGRKTWKSLPARFRPLPGRRNIVVTSQADFDAPGAQTAASVDAALALAQDDPAVWVIGGAQLYASTIDQADQLEVTMIRGRFSGDTFAPAINDQHWFVAVETDWLTAGNGLEHKFIRYTRSDR